MKYLTVSALVCLAYVPGIAFGACTPASQVKGSSALSSVLQGNTVCASRGNDSWQEFHQTGGALIDYKKGPSDRIDPTKQVGTWSVSGAGSNTVVNYNYGTGGSYSYSVHANGGNSYSMCAGAAEQLVSLRAGQGACP